jgi:uncharacterized protein YndB with AHSA1/START domain
MDRIKERMMAEDFVARASTKIRAPVAKVWEALVNPEKIKLYMFGTTVASSWKEGSPITWKGEWEGRAYEDKGKILQMKPERILRYTHFSPLTGEPDKPENYHTITIELSSQGDATSISLIQDKNPTEKARQHSEKNWTMMLSGLKKLLETTG